MKDQPKRAVALGGLVLLACGVSHFIGGQWIPWVLLLLSGVGMWWRVDRPETADAPAQERDAWWAAALKSGLEGTGVCLVVLPLYLAVQYGLSRGVDLVQWRFAPPPDLTASLATNVIVVAIPEELFFRGILQPGLDGLSPRRWTVLRARTGPGLFAAAALFGLCHVILQPANVTAWLVVVPGLLFGWLYARRRSIVGPVICHVACNLTIAVFPPLAG